MEFSTIATNSVDAKQDKTVEVLQESRQQPIWHVIVLHILTLSTYWPFWFAKNWSLLIHAYKLAAGEESPDERLVPYEGGNDQLDGVRGKDPILLTIGMFVPIVNLILAFQLFSQISKLTSDRQSFRALHPKQTAALLLLSMIGLYTLGYLPSTLFLLCLSSFAPMAVAQHWLNQYWKRNEPPDSLVRGAFSTTELIAVIIGSLFLGLIVITPFVVPH